MDILAGDEDPHRATYLLSTQGLEIEEGDYEDDKAVARAIAEHIVDIHNRSLDEANRNCWLDKLRAEQQRVEQLRSDLDKARAEVTDLIRDMRGIDGCFEAALCEGWIDALANGDLDAIRDLFSRRIEYARHTAVNAIAKHEEKQPQTTAP